MKANQILLEAAAAVTGGVDCLKAVESGLAKRGIGRDKVGGLLYMQLCAAVGAAVPPCKCDCGPWNSGPYAASVNAAAMLRQHPPYSGDGWDEAPRRTAEEKATILRAAAEAVVKPGYQPTYIGRYPPRAEQNIWRGFNRD